MMSRVLEKKKQLILVFWSASIEYPCQDGIKTIMAKGSQIKQIKESEKPSKNSLTERQTLACLKERRLRPVVSWKAIWGRLR